MNTSRSSRARKRPNQSLSNVTVSLGGTRELNNLDEISERDNEFASIDPRMDGRSEFMTNIASEIKAVDDKNDADVYFNQPVKKSNDPNISSLNITYSNDQQRPSSTIATK